MALYSTAHSSFSPPPNVLRVLAPVTALFALNEPLRGVRSKMETDTLSLAGEGLEDDVQLEGNEGEDGLERHVEVVLHEGYVCGEGRRRTGAERALRGGNGSPPFKAPLSFLAARPLRPTYRCF